VSLNVANRVIVTLLAAAVAAACLGGFLSLQGVLYPDPKLYGLELAATISNLKDLSGTEAVGVAAVLIALFFASAFLVGLELRPARTRPYLVASTDMGDVVIERSTVVEFIEYVGRQVSGVQAMVARVSLQDSGGLAIRATVTVDNKAVVSELAENVREAVIRKVEGQLGLSVDQIDTRFRMNTRRSRTVVK